MLRTTTSSSLFAALAFVALGSVLFSLASPRAAEACVECRPQPEVITANGLLYSHQSTVPTREDSPGLDPTPRPLPRGLQDTFYLRTADSETLELTSYHGEQVLAAARSLDGQTVRMEAIRLYPDDQLTVTSIEPAKSTVLELNGVFLAPTVGYDASNQFDVRFLSEAGEVFQIGRAHV